MSTNISASLENDVTYLIVHSPQSENVEKMVDRFFWHMHADENIDKISTSLKSHGVALLAMAFYGLNFLLEN